MDKALQIAVLGGTGKAGRYVANKAVESGYKVRMLVRNPDKVTNRANGIEIVKGDARDREAIRKLLQGCHAVINTLGQPVRDEPIYSSVTSTVLSVMLEFSIRRYIGVAGASLNIKGDKKRMVNRIGSIAFELLFPKMINDRKKELAVLINSDVEWTLVRLPFVVEGEEKGVIKENLTDMPGKTIANGDIATFLVSQASDKKYVAKTPFISN